MEIPERLKLKKEYDTNYESRAKLTKELELFLEKALSVLPSNLTIKGRVKNFQSYYDKILRYLQKAQEEGGKISIHDKIGVRIICPFLEDIDAVEQVLKDSFKILEIEMKGTEYSFKEFGYESHHIVIEIPDFLGAKFKKPDGSSFAGETAEIQVRTILQEAWAEVEHEFVYKAEFTPFGAPMRRKLAAINANLSLTDTLFQEFRTYQKQLNRQLNKRRERFYNKIENSMDAFMNEERPERAEDTSRSSIFELKQKDSIDDLLLNALYSHNEGRFQDAELFYSRILELNPEDKIKGIIYQHRGLAYFVQSKYDAAISDFKDAIKFKEEKDKPLYYLGIVHSCEKRYIEALDAFTKSIEINPFRKFCYLRRGEVYYHLNDYPAALADCETALSNDSSFEPALKLKALILKKLAV